MIKMRCGSCRRLIRMDLGERMRKRNGVRYHLDCYLKKVVGK
jgi:hypothetical protein